MKLIYTRHEEKALSSAVYEGPVAFGLEIEVPDDADLEAYRAQGFEEKEAYDKAQAADAAKAQEEWDAKFQKKKEAIAKADIKKDKEVQSQAQQ